MEKQHQHGVSTAPAKPSLRKIIFSCHFLNFPSQLLASALHLHLSPLPFQNHPFPPSLAVSAGGMQRVSPVAANVWPTKCQPDFSARLSSHTAFEWRQEKDRQMVEKRSKKVENKRDN